jgi:hypothetical protein
MFTALKATGPNLLRLPVTPEMSIGPRISTTTQISSLRYTACVICTRFTAAPPTMNEKNDTAVRSLLRNLTICHEPTAPLGTPTLPPSVLVGLPIITHVTSRALFATQSCACHLCTIAFASNVIDDVTANFRKYVWSPLVDVCSGAHPRPSSFTTPTTTAIELIGVACIVGQ